MNELATFLNELRNERTPTGSWNDFEQTFDFYEYSNGRSIGISFDYEDKEYVFGCVCSPEHKPLMFDGTGREMVEQLRKFRAENDRT